MKEEAAKKLEAAKELPRKPSRAVDDFEDELFTPLPSVLSIKPADTHDKEKGLRKVSRV